VVVGATSGDGFLVDVGLDPTQFNPRMPPTRFTPTQVAVSVDSDARRLERGAV